MSASERERLREQLRRAADDGERLYRHLMHEDEVLTVAESHRLHGILTRELESALGFVDALLDALDTAEKERDARRDRVLVVVEELATKLRASEARAAAAEKERDEARRAYAQGAQHWEATVLIARASLSREALTAENKRLREALAAMLARYTGLVESGDCGFWNAEQEREVIVARAALGREPA